MYHELLINCIYEHVFVKKYVYYNQVSHVSVMGATIRENLVLTFSHVVNRHSKLYIYIVSLQLHRYIMCSLLSSHDHMSEMTDWRNVLLHMNIGHDPI